MTAVVAVEELPLAAAVAAAVAAAGAAVVNAFADASTEAPGTFAAVAATVVTVANCFACQSYYSSSALQQSVSRPEPVPVLC